VEDAVPIALEGGAAGIGRFGDEASPRLRGASRSGSEVLGLPALGVGASVLVSRGRETPTDEEGQPTGPTMETRFITIAPQVSLNFGTARGWSYLSGGLGQSVYDTRLAETPVDNARKVRTVNYGGGARWFAKPHLAFALDLRFYAVDGQEATASLVATDRATLLVFSLGVAFK